MTAAKRFFLGKDDPDRIMLEEVFPVGDVVFSTPFEEAGRHHRVVIEGGEPYVDFIADHIHGLTEYDEMNPYGRWVAIAPYGEDEGLEVFYEPLDKSMPGLRLLVFVLRADLVKACDLRLSSVARVTVIRGHITCLYQAAPLPAEIGNGQIELPAIIVPPPRLN
jgi:hypothetical protein